MARFDKNNEEFSLIIRFLKGKLSKSEQEDLEHVIKHDAFLSDALKGFSNFDPLVLSSDLNAFYSSSLIKKNKRLRYIYVIIACVFIVSFLLIFHSNPQKEEMLSEDDAMKFSLPLDDDTVESDPLYVEEELIKFDDETDDDKPANEEVLLQENSQKRENLNQDVPSEIRNQTQLPISDSETNNVDTLDDSGYQGMDGENDSLKQIAIAQVEQLPVDFTPALSGIPQLESENIVRENAESYEQNPMDAGAEELLNSDAEPVSGFSEFDSYLNENMIYPLSEERKRRQVVRVSFEVDVNGFPGNYEFLRSPDNVDFQHELIRLIENGPAWRPAYRDGSPVPEHVTLRVVFRP